MKYSYLIELQYSNTSTNTPSRHIYQAGVQLIIANNLVAEDLTTATNFQGIQEPSVYDEKNKEILSLLVKIRLDNERYLQEERKTTQIDELGLRRVEQHNPPSLTDLVELMEPDDA